MQKMKAFFSILAVRLISSIVVLLLVFSGIVSTIGYIRFTQSLTAEYNDSAFRTAETAATLVNAEHIDEYLRTGGDSDEYRLSLERLNILCQKQNVTLLYVIAVDTGDYGRFKSVFNTVNDSSGYTPWDVGYERDTTNEEYRLLYEQLYTGGLSRGTVVRTSGLNGAMPHITSLIPLRDSQGVTRAVLCVQRPMSELRNGRMIYLRRVAAAAVIAAALASVSISVYLNRQFVVPVRAITREAERFAGENSVSAANTLEHISDIREISTLAASLSKMEDDTVRSIQNLTAITAEKERIGTELALAKRIQEDMVPNVFPAFPDCTDFDIYASMTPAKEVGGDFYDFFLLDEDHLALVMADVSGKGVPAALFMMAAKILIQNFALTGRSPGQVLDIVNEQICRHNREEMFVTVWLGFLDLSTGVLTAANAGHEYPAIRASGEPFRLLEDKHDFVIGSLEGLRFGEYRLQLRPGAKLFVYTDGVPEATDENQALFGTKRMLEALNRDPEQSPEKLLEAVNGAVAAFVGDAPQFDDLTMLCLEYRGRQSGGEG